MTKLINGLCVSDRVTQLLIELFEFKNFDTIIILVVFVLANTLKYQYVDTIRQHKLPPLLMTMV